MSVTEVIEALWWFISSVCVSSILTALWLVPLVMFLSYQLLFKSIDNEEGNRMVEEQLAAIEESRRRAREDMARYRSDPGENT